MCIGWSVLKAAWDFQCSGTVPSAWRTEVKDESSSSEENDEEEEEVQEAGGSSEEEEVRSKRIQQNPV